MKEREDLDKAYETLRATNVKRLSLWVQLQEYKADIMRTFSGEGAEDYKTLEVEYAKVAAQCELDEMTYCHALSLYQVADHRCIADAIREAFKVAAPTKAEEGEQ